MTYWAIWIRQPQTLGLRRAIFQIHLWTGIVIGLYIIAICLSGSVLVYRNELYRAFSPTNENPSPLVLVAVGARLRERHAPQELGRHRRCGAHRTATRASGSAVTGAPASSSGATKL